MSPRTRKLIVAFGLTGLIVAGVVAYRNDVFEKRVQVIHPGKLVRGAWQRPSPLRRIIAREGIKTIVTLTAINATDPKFVDQSRVVDESGIDWLIIPMRGSRATVEQMAVAADLLADPARQPVFFHCVAGHHRTSLAHAAYLIRHEGYSAEEAWKAVSTLSWARPEALVDRNDQFLIEEFARVQASLAPPTPENSYWEVGGAKSSPSNNPADPRVARPDAGVPRGLDRLEPGARQLRDGAAGTALPIRTNVEPDA